MVQFLSVSLNDQPVFEMTCQQEAQGHDILQDLLLEESNYLRYLTDFQVLFFSFSSFYLTDCQKVLDCNPNTAIFITKFGGNWTKTVEAISFEILNMGFCELPE